MKQCSSSANITQADIPEEVPEETGTTPEEEVEEVTITTTTTITKRLRIISAEEEVLDTT